MGAWREGELCDTCHVNRCSVTNKFGVCQQTPECLREYKRRWQNPNWRERRGKNLRPGPGIGAVYHDLTCIGDPVSIRRGGGGMERRLPVRCRCGHEYLLRLERWVQITMCHNCGVRQEKNQKPERWVLPGVYVIWFPDAAILKVGFTSQWGSGKHRGVHMTEGELRDRFGIKAQGFLLLNIREADLSMEVLIQGFLSNVFAPKGSHTRVAEWFDTGELTADEVSFLVCQARDLAVDGIKTMKGSS